MRAPVLFVSHGSPLFALDEGQAGAALRRLGQELPAPNGVIVVSPHWQTQGIVVQAGAAPETWHDFSGFPEALRALDYPAPGAPALAGQVQALLGGLPYPVYLDPSRPRDHGAWVPLMHLLPGASVPVLQVSMPHDLTAASALELGRALAALRVAGTWIVGSGSMTHNLFEMGSNDVAYAKEFAAWVRHAITAGAVDALLDYRARAPHAARAHPTEEHFLPLLVALGAGEGSPVQWIDGGFTHGVLSMDAYVWNDAPAPDGQRL